MRKPEPCEQPSYMFPIVTVTEVHGFDDKLMGMYPDDQMRAAIKESCFLDGVLFDRRCPENCSGTLRTSTDSPMLVGGVSVMRLRARARYCYAGNQCSQRLVRALDSVVLAFGLFYELKAR